MSRLAFTYFLILACCFSVFQFSTAGFSSKYYESSHPDVYQVAENDSSAAKNSDESRDQDVDVDENPFNPLVEIEPHIEGIVPPFGWATNAETQRFDISNSDYPKDPFCVGLYRPPSNA